MRCEASGRRVDRTATAGWMAVIFGAVHIVVVPVRRRKNLSEVWADGWWNAFTLDEPTTLAEAERAVTFWQTLGSFGWPMLTLGGHLICSARRGRRVPRWLGGIVLAWGLPFVTAMPASPGWALPIIGGLIVAGDASDGREPVADHGRGRSRTGRFRVGVR